MILSWNASGSNAGTSGTFIFRRAAIPATIRHATAWITNGLSNRFVLFERGIKSVAKFLGLTKQANSDACAGHLRRGPYSSEVRCEKIEQGEI